MIFIILYGGLAQLEERMLCKHEAPGSKPGFSNNNISSISLVAMTPVCGTGGPGSIPGWSIIFFLFYFIYKPIKNKIILKG